jgi:RNA polymerase sigma-32 factor
MSYTASLPVLSQESGLISYLDKIKKFPMLSEKEEQDLAMKWFKEEDVKAAQTLVTSHLRLVAKIASQFKGYGLPMVDLISEGNIGLMIAVKKFDPFKGYRLSTYAMWWIKATIQDYVLKSWSMVKMGTSSVQKKLFFNLRKIKNKLFQLNQGRIPVNETELIAQELEVSKEDVAEMNDRFGQFESSLNDYTNDEGSVEILDTIASPDNHEDVLMESQELDYQRQKFSKAFSQLNEREQDIIQKRKLTEKPYTLDVLSKTYGISTERVRQIEERALEKLKKMVTN